MESDRNDNVRKLLHLSERSKGYNRQFRLSSVRKSHVFFGKSTTFKNITRRGFTNLVVPAAIHHTLAKLTELFSPEHVNTL